MYRIYLKRKTQLGSEVDPKSRTITPSSSAAEVAFRELIVRDDLRGQYAAAVLSLNNRQLMYHRFDHKPGMSDYVGPDDIIRLYHDQ